MEPVVRKMRGFTFSPDQKREILEILGRDKDDQEAQHFISHLELPMASFQGDLQYDDKEIYPLPRVMRSEVKRIKAKVEKLRADLEQLSLGGAGNQIRLAEFALTKRIGLTEGLAKALREYTEVLDRTLQDLPPVQPGNPGKHLELGFVMHVARVYRLEFHSFPPVNRGSHFNELMKRLFCWANYQLVDCGRLVRRAVDLVREDDFNTPLEEDTAKRPRRRNSP